MIFHYNEFINPYITRHYDMKEALAQMIGQYELHSERFFGAHLRDIAQKDPLRSSEPDLTVLLMAKTKACIKLVSRKMTQHFHDRVKIDTTGTEDDLAERLINGRYDIMIADSALSGIDALFDRAIKICPDTPLIFIGRMVGEERVAGLLRQGAVDYVLKDRIGRLPYAVMRALQNAKALREKKHAEIALARSLKHLEEAQRVAHMGSFEYNAAERSVIWSDEVLRIFGVGSHESQSLPETVLAMLDAPDRQRLIANCHSTIERFVPQDEIYCFTNPEGDRHWFRLRAQASEDVQTRAALMIGTVQDITELKAAEQETRMRTEFEHTVLVLSREWINASPEKFGPVMDNTMRVIAEHCNTDWAALYRFDHDTRTAVCQHKWHRDAQSLLPMHGLLPLLPIEKAFSGCEKTHFACIMLPGEELRPFGAFALRTDGSLWGMLACGTTHSKGAHPQSNLVNLFCEMLISVLRRREREIVLQEACENNRLILDSISDGFCAFDENGAILDAGKGLASGFGKTVQECIGKKLCDFFPEKRYGDLGKKRMEVIGKVFSTGKTIKFVDVRDARWYHNRLYPVFKNGKVAAVSLFSSDITDKQKADEEYRRIILLEKEAEVLRGKEREYLEILDGSTVGSWIYDVQSGIMRYSSQWQKRLGIKAESAEPLERYYDKVLHPEDKAWAIEESTRILRVGLTKYKMEYRLKTVKGGYIWVLAQGKIIYNENGLPVKIYGTSIDITDRKKMEEALRESQKLLSMIIEGMSDHIYLKDKESRIVVSNSAVARFLNLTPEDILGENELEYFQDKQQARIIVDNDCRIMESGQEETLEEKAGTRIFLSKKAPWRDANGDVIGLFGISRDITERINMMQELKRAAEELKQKNQLITDFFINISHEFKTPISIMMIATEMIEQYLSEGIPDLHSIHSNVNHIRQNMFRLSRLVNNLLDITKIDAGFMQPCLVNRDIAGVLQYLVSSLQPYTRRQGVDITYSGPDGAVMMPVDMAMIDRIILNLVSNALKHTPKGGEINISCEVQTQSVRIAVRDNGEGIPLDKQEIIFDRFRQVNTTLVRSSEGCGIGLALVKSLVQMLGGSIRVRSEPGIGSEFCVELPMQQEVECAAIETEGLMLFQRIEMELADIVIF